MGRYESTCIIPGMGAMPIDPCRLRGAVVSWISKPIAITREGVDISGVRAIV
jgi:hypothetical protein